jgi:hypothetical protein
MDASSRVHPVTVTHVLHETNHHTPGSSREAVWLQILGERHDDILHEVNVHKVNVHAVDVNNKTQGMTSRLLLLLLTLHLAILRQHKHVRGLPL